MPSAGYSHFYTTNPQHIHFSRRRVSMPSAGYSHFYSYLKSYYQSSVGDVSMPSAGYSHFYLGAGSGGACNRHLCVNALGGLVSCLQEVSLITLAFAIVCQCPRRAILISTFTTRRLGYVWFVSMPSAGYSHFYRQKT